MKKEFISMAFLAVALCACNETGGARMAGAVAGLDPTGIAGTAASFAQSAAPADDDASENLQLSRIATRLRDVAAGRTDRPNLMAAVDSQMGQAIAMQNLALASTIAQAAVGGAMTGGVGLLAAAPGIAMQAASTGMVTAQMSAARGQVQSAMAQADAERAASRVVPQEDRPVEANAILSVIDGVAGRSATWSNPETGASGKVSIQHVSNGGMPGLVCRIVNQEWRGSEGTRKGATVVCKQNGDWYDLS